MNKDERNFDLPPGFRATSLREYRDAFSHAQSHAADDGAGTLAWVRRYDAIEAAVVLEPEEPLRSARCALYAGMNAAADALSQFCPPEKPIDFAWPDTILLDGGIIGGCRLAWPPGVAEADTPYWLVLGLHVRCTVPSPAQQLFVKGTSLETEGFESVDPKPILESFARHLMAAFDGWQAHGVTTVTERYLARMHPTQGEQCELDANGDLLVRKRASPQHVLRSPLTEALATPQWLDPATGEPWL